MSGRKKTIRETADALLGHYKKSLSAPDTDALRTYIESLTQRFASMEYALEQIRAVARAEATTTVSYDPFENFRQKHEFYTDAFWTFGYSLFDITAHVMNIIHPLQDEESKVAFGRALFTVSPEYKGAKTPYSTKLNNRLKTIYKNRHFNRLKGYRQCCLHRRAVAVKDDISISSVSHPYSHTTVPTTIIESTICDDVDALTPKFKKGRQLDLECDEIRDFIEDNVRAILSIL